MPVPAIRPTAIGVYVFRAVGAGGAGEMRYEFLQIRRSAKARGHAGLWQTVYGGVEMDAAGPEGRETAVMAALRELREETGLVPARMFQVEYLETFYFRPTDTVLLMPVFGVEVGREAEVRLNEEHDGVRWVGEGEIGEKFMWRTQREALGILLEQLRRPGAAGLLEIDLGAMG
ncbi:MAG TPA: NUDIX domain-containing protein [Phycisphaerae bacterium]|nr:NUDIX domain-containing protein [Phycisphaerae bacterium]